MIDQEDELPPRWTWRTVGDVAARLQHGSSAKTHDMSRGVPVLRMGNIIDGRLDFSNLKYLPAGHAEFPELLLEPGDILFNRTNSPELVGKSAMYRAGDPSPCSFASYLIRVQLRDYEPALATYYLNSPAGREWVASCVSQQVGQANVSGGKLRGLRLPSPPQDEQRRIVAKLDALRARSRRAKDALDAVPALLDRLRQSIRAAAFRGDLTADWREQNPEVEPASELLKRIRIERRRRWEEAELAKFTAKGKTPKDDRWKEKYVEPEPVDETELPELPTGWSWDRMGTVAPLQPGFAFSSKGFVKGGTRLLKGVNVRDGWLASDELDHWPTQESAQFASYELRKGDIVLAMDRPVYSSGSRATKVALLDDTWEGALLLQRVGRFKKATELEAGYLFAFLRGSDFRKHIVGTQKGSQDGTDLPHVSAETVDSAVVPIAPAAEQRRIASVFDLLDAHTRDLDRSFSAAASTLRQLESSVLAAAFRGELLDRESDGASGLDATHP